METTEISVKLACDLYVHACDDAKMVVSHAQCMRLQRSGWVCFI